jgi:hypothetical protein
VRYGSRGALALLVLVLAGCAHSTQPPVVPTTAAQPGLVVPLVVTRTGGISGQSRTLDIAADGNWIYTPAGQTAQHGQYTPDQLAALQAALADPALLGALSHKADPSVHCADTYTYTFRFGLADTYTYDDCPGPPPAPVMTLLTAVHAGTPF